MTTKKKPASTSTPAKSTRRKKKMSTGTKVLIAVGVTVVACGAGYGVYRIKKSSNKKAKPLAAGPKLRIAASSKAAA